MILHLPGHVHTPMLANVQEQKAKDALIVRGMLVHA